MTLTKTLLASEWPKQPWDKFSSIWSPCQRQKQRPDLWSFDPLQFSQLLLLLLLLLFGQHPTSRWNVREMGRLTQYTADGRGTVYPSPKSRPGQTPGVEKAGNVIKIGRSSTTSRDFTAHMSPCPLPTTRTTTWHYSGARCHRGMQLWENVI